jgi:hypothetical protein
MEHHPKINQLKRLFNSYGVPVRYFDKQSLFVPGRTVRNYVRRSFLIRFMSQTVPGARWTVDYFTVIQHTKETVNIPSFDGAIIHKLAKLGFLNPIEIQSQQKQII